MCEKDANGSYREEETLNVGKVTKSMEIVETSLRVGCGMTWGRTLRDAGNASGNRIDRQVPNYQKSYFGSSSNRRDLPACTSVSNPEIYRIPSGRLFQLTEGWIWETQGTC